MYSGPTSQTPHFRATADRQHVDKLELAALLPLYAPRCGLDLRATLVVGPEPPLQAYRVVAFIQEADQVRVNLVVAPHARITFKGTAVLSEAAAGAFFDRMKASPLLQDGLPPPVDASMRRDDSAYQILFSEYGESELTRRWGRYDAAHPTAAGRRFFGDVEALLKQMTPTYEHGKTEPVQVIHGLCPETVSGLPN